MRERSNLRATLMWDSESADYWLNFQAVGEQGAPLAEVATIKTDDPQLQEKLRIMAQAFRMGQRHH